MIHSLDRSPRPVANPAIAALRSRGVIGQIQGQGGTLPGNRVELVVVQVDRDHHAAERGGNLHRIRPRRRRHLPTRSPARTPACTTAW